MRITRHPIATAALLGCLWPLAAHADSTCTDADRANAGRAVQAAEALERAGKASEALQPLAKARQDECLSTPGIKQAQAAFARATRTLGDQAEKAGDFDKAHGYFLRGAHLPEADRTMVKLAQAKKSEPDALGRAIHYFEQQRRDAASAGEMRRLAEVAGNEWLQKEERSFAGGRSSSLPELESARDFLRLVGDAAGKRAIDRAAQRGDTMAKGTMPKALEQARDYYGFADLRDKSESIKPTAQRLGAAAEKRGEHRIAEQFYELSGDSARIEGMEKSREKTEATRQKSFKKGQDDLEKELKM